MTFLPRAGALPPGAGGSGVTPGADGSAGVDGGGVAGVSGAGGVAGPTGGGVGAGEGAAGGGVVGSAGLGLGAFGSIGWLLFFKNQNNAYGYLTAESQKAKVLNLTWNQGSGREKAEAWAFLG